MFSRKGVLPVDMINVPNCSDELQLSYSEDISFFQSEHAEHRRLQLEAVKKNILKAQAKQKEQYDRKHHKPEVFQVGSIVLKKDFLKKKRVHGELDPKWVGPYKIIRSIGRGLYGLELVEDPTKVVSRVNGVHLKPYHIPENQALDSSSPKTISNNETPLDLTAPLSSQSLASAVSKELNTTSVHVSGVTSSTPVREGGFFVDFSLDVSAITNSPPPAIANSPTSATENSTITSAANSTANYIPTPAIGNSPPPAIANSPTSATENSTILPHDTATSPPPAIANSPTSATEKSTILPHDILQPHPLLLLPTHSLLLTHLPLPFIVCADRDVLQNVVHARETEFHVG